MTDAEIKQEQQLRSQLRTVFLQCGMRFASQDAERTIAAKLTELGVTCDTSLGYLRMTQGATEIAPSGMAERIRKDLPNLFSADPKRDSIASRQDLERGSASEIASAKSNYIREHGLSAFEALPRTRAEAEIKNTPVNQDLTRAQYLALPFADRVRLSGVFSADTLARIMARRG
jgi:hypothetical protein